MDQVYSNNISRILRKDHYGVYLLIPNSQGSFNFDQIMVVLLP